MTTFGFFIIECYSFDEPSNQILCIMVVNFFLEFIGNAGGSDQISHSHESLGNAGGSGKNRGSQSELNLNCDDGPGILDSKY